MRTKKRRGLFIQPAFSSPLSSSGLPELRAPFLFSAEYPRCPSRSGQILSSQYPEPRNSRLLIPLFGLGECESKADPCQCDSLHFQDRLLSPFVCVYRFALFRAKLDGSGGGGDWDHFSGLSVQVSANALHLQTQIIRERFPPQKYRKSGIPNSRKQVVCFVIVLFLRGK